MKWENYDTLEATATNKLKMEWRGRQEGELCIVEGNEE